MKQHLWSLFIDVINREVVPALGCTEPVSVALATAIAIDKLGVKNDASSVNIEASVSPNLMKNGMGVGIPGTGMIGLPMAATIGAVAGDHTANLEVLKNVTAEDVAIAKQMLDNKQVTVGVADVANILYAKVTVFTNNAVLQLLLLTVTPMLWQLKKMASLFFRLRRQ